jgi:hypothetical protein
MQTPDSKGMYAAVQWGLEGDIRVPADYDGDGITDIAVWRPSNGTWYIIRSRDGFISHIQWGLTTRNRTGGIEDVPVPADYDGDGVDDLAVWRPVDGRWYVLTSKSGFYPPKALICEWGLYGDVPVPPITMATGAATQLYFDPQKIAGISHKAKPGIWTSATLALQVTTSSSQRTTPGTGLPTWRFFVQEFGSSRT